MPDFLLEIGVEEIPARMIATAEAELRERVQKLLEREHLAQGGDVRSFSTPRRLAVFATGVVSKQPDTTETLTGPAAKVAFKDGQPTPAAHAFAKKAGVAVEELATTQTAKGEYVTAIVERPGRAASQILAEALPAEIAGVYWPKSMYWRPGKPERFIRPVRWLVCLLDGDVVGLKFAGIRAGRESRGHRILHGDARVVISAPAAYEEAMRAAYVEPRPTDREHIIRKALDKATRAVPGARWREDASLLDTVVNLTEWPSVVLGGFEPEHLALPEEVLVTVMRDHQKYFAVEDAQGKLAPHFLAVLNTQVGETGADIIRHGNARVLRARFNDARFFWDTDQKIPLRDRVEMLKAVTFQQKLGSYYDKTQANIRLARAIAATLASNGVAVDSAAVEEAATLAKADLTAELVKEFTELQGIIGGLYARAQGVRSAAAQAIYDQYSPAGNEGEIPSATESVVLGLADRLNTIVDMFAIGLEPSGSKDPFALRRAASSAVRLLAAQHWRLGLATLIEIATVASQQPGAQSVKPQVAEFFAERIAFYLRDTRGLPYDVVKAVMASGADDIADAEARAQAVAAVRDHADFAAIAAAFKRTRNILSQAEAKGDAPAAVVQTNLLTAGPERELYDAWQRIAPQVESLRSGQNYGSALEAMATLRVPVDAFFDAVMVMAPEPELRTNRLALLRGLLSDFSRIADFAEIVPAAA